MTKSSEIFKDSVYPRISSLIGGGDLIPVEAVTESEMAETLDRLSGIDFWYVDHDEGMFGIASRVQPGGTNWETFTVRRRRFSGAETEFEKRKRQIDNGFLYPKWTCQAYTDSFTFIDAAVVRTEDLIQFIDEGARGRDYIINSTHNADFFVVDWSDIEEQYSNRFYRY